MHRIGLGCGFQKIDSGKIIVLGGVEVKSPKSPTSLTPGHDTLARCLCDALLGALALGDLEKILIEKDKSKKQPYSISTLKDVCKIVWGKGYRVVNADIVLMGDDLKITGHRSQIRESLSTAMNVRRMDVGLKMTGGAWGSDSGVFVQAVVLLETSVEIK